MFIVFSKSCKLSQYKYLIKMELLMFILALAAVLVICCCVTNFLKT